MALSSTVTPHGRTAQTEKSRVSDCRRGVLDGLDSGRELQATIDVLAISGGYRGGQEAMAPLEAHVPTLPLQKSIESKAGKKQF